MQEASIHIQLAQATALRLFGGQDSGHGARRPRGSVLQHEDHTETQASAAQKQPTRQNLNKYQARGPPPALPSTDRASSGAFAFETLVPLLLRQ